MLTTEEQLAARAKAIEGRRKDKEAAIALRRKGYSYEEIGDELGQTPWLVFRWCNPQKSNEQVVRWTEKHYPPETEERYRAEERALESAKLRMKRGWHNDAY